MPVASWSTTASDNATADSDSSIIWSEGQAPSSVNNSARAMMAEIKKWYNNVPQFNLGNVYTGTNTFQARIVSNGPDAYTLIGNSALRSTPAYGAPKLQAEGVAGTYAAAMFTMNSSTATYLVFNLPGTGVVGTIVGNGGAGVTYNTTSDYRLKDVDPEKPVGSLDRVKALKVYRGHWTADSTQAERSLMLAHEIQSVMPEVVTGEKDAVWHGEDENGNPVSQPMYQQVDYLGMIPDLVAALQEASAKIEALEARIEVLEQQAA